MACSLEQINPQSKLLPMIISRTAFRTSAVFSTKAGTLPGPTPMAGLPLLWAALTMLVPPVDKIMLTRGSFISAAAALIPGSERQLISPSGAPALTAASANTFTDASVQRPAMG